MNTNNIAHKDNCVYSLFIKPFTRKTSYAILIISSTYKMSVILSCKKNPVNLTRVNGIFFIESEVNYDDLNETHHPV